MYRPLLIILFLCSTAIGSEPLARYELALPEASRVESDYVNKRIQEYESADPEPPLEELQCPIPRECRVKNYTGIQCVYSSIEMLGRWAEEEKLVEPPITSRSDCKGYSGPSRAGEILTNLGVKFEQTYGDREKGMRLIKSAMRAGRGVLWDVPGHAMVLVHYDEKEDRVCWVDNSDKTLKVQQTTVEKFKKRWGSWVLVIYAEPDMPPEKTRGFGFPVVDMDRPGSVVPRGFIPFPLD